MSTMTVPEARRSFPCFGGQVTLAVSDHEAGEPELATQGRRLERWHRRLTRFDPDSELSRLNASPDERVETSRLVALFVSAAISAARLTDGLVDATQLDAVERAGYRNDRHSAVPLPLALRLAPRREPARPSPERRWDLVAVEGRSSTVVRPPGVRLDSGGIAKGLFADLVARSLGRAESYAVDCCGDIRLGGVARHERPVRVDDPFGGGVLHEFRVSAGGVATSGISRRSWIDDDRHLAHHVIDPGTGRPAFTGLVQVTALAPTALEAEIRAKAALLSGPEGARRWLPHGGLLVPDAGCHEVIELR